MSVEKYFDITVIVLTYNSRWEEIKATLNSIYAQKQIKIQIIISDDGSKNNFYNELNTYFLDHKISDYILNLNKDNKGTVKNIASTLQYIQGKYVKLISPGDLLYSDMTLANMCYSLKKHDCCVGFGKVIPYKYEDQICIISHKKNPVCQHLYKNVSNYKQRDIFVDYLLANDTIIGASTIYESDIFNVYICKIKESLVYAEDYVLRLMVFDGIKILFMDYFVVWYEYGCGISTNKNAIWDMRLHQDFVNSDIIIRQCETKISAIQKKYIKFLSICSKYPRLKKILKILYFPKVIFFRVIMKTSTHKKIKSYDTSYLHICMNMNEDVKEKTNNENTICNI